MNDPVDAEIVGFVVIDRARAREKGHDSISRELLSRGEREKWRERNRENSWRERRRWLIDRPTVQLYCARRHTYVVVETSS